MACSKCENDFQDIEFKIYCDFCKALYCQTCSKCTTQEVQVLQYKNRSMLFACITCKDSIQVQGDKLDFKKQMQESFNLLHSKVSDDLSQSLNGLNTVLQNKFDTVEKHIIELLIGQDDMKFELKKSFKNPEASGDKSPVVGDNVRLCELECKNAELLKRVEILEQQLEKLKNLTSTVSSSKNLQETMPASQLLLKAQPKDEKNYYFPIESNQQKTGNINNTQLKADNSSSLQENFNKKQPTVSSSTDKGLFPGTERIQWLCLGQCDPQTTEKDITRYMRSQLSIRDAKCHILDKNDDVASFRIGVKESLLKGLLDPNLWPAGTKIEELGPHHPLGTHNHRYFHQRKNRHH